MFGLLGLSLVPLFFAQARAADRTARTMRSHTVAILLVGGLTLASGFAPQPRRLTTTSRVARATTNLHASARLMDPAWGAVDPFAILGLPLNATRACVKAAFRDLAFIYHPDSAQATNMDTSDAEKFMQIAEAHTMLLDDSARERLANRARATGVGKKASPRSTRANARSRNSGVRAQHTSTTTAARSMKAKRPRSMADVVDDEGWTQVKELMRKHYEKNQLKKNSRRRQSSPPTSAYATAAPPANRPATPGSGGIAGGGSARACRKKRPKERRSATKSRRRDERFQDRQAGRQDQVAEFYWFE